MRILGRALSGLVVLAVVTAAWAESANKVGGGYLVYPGKEKGTVIFSHLSHGEKGAGFKCADCHPAMDEKKGTLKMADIEAGKACGQCHDGKTKAKQGEGVAFAVANCNGCHMPDKEIVFKTKAPLGDVKFLHSAHTGVVEGGKSVEKAGYSCGDCHPKIFEPKTGAAAGKMKMPHKEGSCASCHDGKKTGHSGKAAPTAMGNCMTCHKKA